VALMSASEHSLSLILLRYPLGRFYTIILLLCRTTGWRHLFWLLIRIHAYLTYLWYQVVSTPSVVTVVRSTEPTD
jgi:hypothetical protein